MKKLVVRTVDEEGFAEDNIYGRQARLHLLENEEISPREEAFMEGYEDAS